MNTTDYRLYFDGWYIQSSGQWLIDAIANSRPPTKPRQAYFQSQGQWIPIRRSAIDRAWNAYQQGRAAA